ncbi:hypothetical protein [Hymenobacter volaticus]|uniref:Outer membrane protein beta-barrel domain-containing protein n=1 Tax=Hymenobacter volaticus TaxID=2932254 RepID=A0ABY4G1I9_9BACT|nr:hypothetical protein [Hymenobacter volaticus]UOQ64683.1 hypothetical protein MUN86_14000 [Hymenobacter volaticus]
MKHCYTIISFAILFSIPTLPAQAQSELSTATHRPALLRLGLGSCLNGSGDYGVVKTYLEYAPQFGQHLRLGSRLAVISGSNHVDFGEDYNGRNYTVKESYRAVNIEQEVYWLPFGIHKTVEFGVGVGAFGGYGSSKGLSYGGFSLNQSTNQLEFSYTPSDEQGFHAGYIASLNVNVAIDPARTWRVGGKLSLQNDTRANILPGAQFQISRAW